MRPSTLVGVGRHWRRPAAAGVAALLFLTVLVVVTAPPAAAAATSLRFGGGGWRTPTRDRVIVPVAVNNRADVGAGDFTLEFWMKSSPELNSSGTTREFGCGPDYLWIFGHIMFDRDIDGNDGRDYGIAVYRDGTLAFGVQNASGSAHTICTNPAQANVLDNEWHHVAAQRSSSGLLELYVDGVRQAFANGPTGDISLPNGVSGVNAQLVIGAEKHDISDEFPSYAGLIDEFRLSDAIRYTGTFTRPTEPFTTDGSTAVLYHFDGTAGQTCATTLEDASGNDLHGECRPTQSATPLPQYSADTPFASSPPTTTTTAPTTTTTAPTTTTTSTTTTSTTSTTTAPTTTTTTTPPTTTTTTTPTTTTTTTTAPTTTTTTTTTTAPTTTTTAPPPPPPPPDDTARFTPVTPARLLDTRPTPVIAFQTVTIQVAGRAGVPASATAATLNITAVNPWNSGYLTAYPCDEPKPTVSNVNHGFRQTVANLATVELDANGRVCIYSHTTTDVVVDVTGWWGATGYGYQPVFPTRLTDTRPNRVDTRSVLELQVAGAGPVPAGARAVAANITVTDTIFSGYATAYPCDQPRPLASTLNYALGQTVTNVAAVPLSADGRLCVYVFTAAAVIVDVSGWWGPGATAEMVPLDRPTRLIDTRPTEMAFASTLALQVPAGSEVVALNLTVTGPRTSGFLTAYPCGEPRPLASNLNFAKGQLVSGAALVRPGVGNQVCVYFHAPTFFVADLFAILS